MVTPLFSCRAGRAFAWLAGMLLLLLLYKKGDQITKGAKKLRGTVFGVSSAELNNFQKEQQQQMQNMTDQVTKSMDKFSTAMLNMPNTSKAILLPYRVLPRRHTIWRRFCLSTKLKNGRSACGRAGGQCRKTCEKKQDGCTYPDNLMESDRKYAFCGHCRVIAWSLLTYTSVQPCLKHD